MNSTANAADRNVQASTVIDLREFVAARAGQARTTSIKVAEAFDKQHKHVMDKLRGLECSDQFLTANFSAVKFDHRGNQYDACEMTKDGFMFLVMGFTGKKAAQIKEAYITAFNWMAEQLGISEADLVGTVIGTSGVNVLGRVIDQKASPVPAGLQRSFKHTMKSRLRSRFNVQRTDLIPADCLADACNFVAAYALEGEWLAKEEAPAAFQLTDFQAAQVRHLLHSVAWVGYRWQQGIGKGVSGLNPALYGATVEHMQSMSRAASALDAELKDMLAEIERRQGLGGLRPQQVVARGIAA
ncbi:MAG: Rha family transcriptional regulator [Pseudomonas sp.]|nr:Rha family transcriptional regulator [Pseudomonas sp.]